MYVGDLDVGAAFYTDVLGLPLVLSTTEARFLRASPGSVLILFDVAGLATRESVIPAHGASGPGHVALPIDDDSLAEWRARLARHGVAIEHEQTWPTGARSLYCRDPDGNSVELMEQRHYRMLDGG